MRLERIAFLRNSGQIGLRPIQVFLHLLDLRLQRRLLRGELLVLLHELLSVPARTLRLRMQGSRSTHACHGAEYDQDLPIQLRHANS